MFTQKTRALLIVLLLSAITVMSQGLLGPPPPDEFVRPGVGVVGDAKPEAVEKYASEAVDKILEEFPSPSLGPQPRHIVP